MPKEKLDKVIEQKASITLQDIILLESHINYIHQTKEPFTKLHFLSKIEFKVHEGQNLLVSSIQNIVQSHDGELDLAVLGIACTFFIPNVKEYLKEEKDGTHIDEDLIDSLSKITMSTSRGIMFEKLRGTYLHKAILPLLPNDLPKNLKTTNSTTKAKKT